MKQLDRKGRASPPMRAKTFPFAGIKFIDYIFKKEKQSQERVLCERIAVFECRKTTTFGEKESVVSSLTMHHFTHIRYNVVAKINK